MLNLRLTVLFGFAVLIGIGAGVLSFISGKHWATAVLLGCGSFGGSFVALNALLPVV